MTNAEAPSIKDTKSVYICPAFQMCLLFVPISHYIGSKLNRVNSVTGTYAKACVQVGAECGVDVLDLWTLMQEGGSDYSVYLSDGLHLSDAGNKFAETKLWIILQKKLGSMPIILPDCMDVDNNDPESSLFKRCL
ncbi:hypothetical protein GDO81_023144 [Engystomops pustulosus]|uniref:1-alkyl-2-acetylglycerophosphocholine esterase n=1 Tax=Engystomops pustulosus TaxID=76066 RepID=A0AAV6YR41_ENGPU|nr:hypothetical protein GDO81_023144 [Engystomops pustulosus]